MQVRRDELVSESRRPISEPHDAVIPQIGYIGKHYAPGHPVLFTINPDGGGDTYRRTQEDAKLLPLIEKVRTEPYDRGALDQVFSTVQTNMRTWNLWKIVAPTLKACNADQDSAAILNWCPYRTRGDKKPLSADMAACRERVVLPLLKTMEPGLVIALGIKVAEHVLRLESRIRAPIYVVPRTIGDSRVSPEAQTVLQRIADSPEVAGGEWVIGNRDQ